jgi:hypothetical protein
VTTFDTQDIFNDILDAAASHGFSDSTSSCSSYSSISTNPNAFLPQCGWPLAEYVWYDGSHPTWRVHEILAGKVAQVSCSLPLSRLLFPRPTSADIADPHRHAVNGSARCDDRTVYNGVLSNAVEVVGAGFRCG